MRSYKKLKNIAMMALTLEILYGAAISIPLAGSVPSLHTFVGTVRFQQAGGQFDAPPGTTIKAFINEVESGSTTVITAGNYSIGVSGTYDDEGKNITFRVNGNLAKQTAVFNASMPPPETLDLIADLPEQTDTSSQAQSGSSGGGGGGGGTSGENFSNIELKEKHDVHILKDKVASYAFTNGSHPIVYVNITGNVSAGEVTTAVEALRSTSTLVKSPSSGSVYKNINIWVGTSGFASPKNIKEAVIVFRVLNSWLESNGLAGAEIKMVKWDGSQWVQLETAQRNRDSMYTYFDAKTITFGNFAVTGLKGEAAPTAPSEIGVIGTPADPSPTITRKRTNGFEVILAMTLLYSVYILCRKRR